MPLYKRTPFPLVEAPESLEPHELVFQVRFTKEIFKDYQDYLKRINLYRQRFWTCKITGKMNLTYEEALVSEQLATQKAHLFPKELVAPVLQLIQFSTLKFNDLVNGICKNLQERLVEGDELYGKKEESICQCKILKVLEDANKILYEVGWIDKEKNVIDSSVVKAEDLIRKKLPFTRDVLKSFIRESTYRSLPWIVHEKLAKQHGISTAIPEELQEKISTQGQGSNKESGNQGATHTKKRKKSGTEDAESVVPSKKIKKETEKPPAKPIKYPIDDLLVQPGADDPVFTDRPTPSRDFIVPMDCVGDLLMVWDFCSSYSRMLQLWRFSLDDFQNALCHKENNLVLIVECHSALLHLLIKEKGEYFTAIQNKSRSRKITAVTWTNYICDFLEMQNLPELSSCISTIKRGHYGLIDTQAKVVILRELISQVTETDIFREQLNEIMEQRQALASKRREEAVEENRKKRENKELKKAKNELISENGHDNGENGHVLEGGEDDGNKNDSGKKKSAAKQKSLKETPNSEEDKDAGNEEDGRAKSKEQRKNYLAREIGKCFIHTNPLGKDRNYNRYWFFSREGRIFIESSDFKLWGYYSSTEELDSFMGSLNPKGERERALQTQLKKSYDKICSGLQKRSKFVAHKNAMEEAVLRRSSRVRAPRWDNPALAFLSYVNRYRNK